MSFFNRISIDTQNNWNSVLLRRLLFLLASCITIMASQIPVFAQDAQAKLTGHELCLKWGKQADGMFPVVCAMNMEPHITYRGARDISHNQLVLLIQGGRDEDRLVGLQIIHEMAKQGKHVAIAFGPTSTGSETIFTFAIYAHGTDVTDRTALINSTKGGLPKHREYLTEILNQAYEWYFPSKGIDVE